VIELAGYSGKVLVEDSEGNVVSLCPECGQAFLRIKQGRYGAFQGCSAFPVCRFATGVGYVPGPAIVSKA
jgi:ssDNA-binding Zn-finger/Zn-ribbon topoisomerase 1